VLDEWFEREVKPRLKGQAFLVRYADDFVIGFVHEEDARRVLEVLPKRFGKYGLTLHPDKNATGAVSTAQSAIEYRQWRNSVRVVRPAGVSRITGAGRGVAAG